MKPQSHAQQMLLSLYRKVLRRGLGRPRVEPLPPRVLWSVTPVGVETLVNTSTGGAQEPFVYANLTSAKVYLGRH